MLSSGLQHICFLVDNCPRFRITQYHFMRLLINLFSLGWYFFPKISQILFLVDLMHPGSTLPSRERFWGIETWVIRPHPCLRLHFSKRPSGCDDANKSKLECRHTLKERLPKANLAFRGVKKFNPIVPSADVGNLQTKMNDWRWL